MLRRRVDTSKNIYDDSKYFENDENSIKRMITAKEKFVTQELKTAVKGKTMVHPS